MVDRRRLARAASRDRGRKHSAGRQQPPGKLMNSMNGKNIDLGSVNWAQGMLLTPEHFLRQERYFDSALLWAIHSALDGYGLVGSGGRGEPADRGAARHDPVIDIDDDGEAIKVSVSQCRGISPSGDIIEISPSNVINGSISHAAVLEPVALPR